MHAAERSKQLVDRGPEISGRFRSGKANLKNFPRLCFHRTAVLCSALLQPFFDGFIQTPDGDGRHAPMLALLA